MLYIIIKLPFTLSNKELLEHMQYLAFYHGCNILTNQIPLKEVDKSLIKPIAKLFINLTRYLSTHKCSAHAIRVSKWVE